MKYIFLNVVTLLIMSGCSSKQEPSPVQVVEPAVKAEEPKPKPKPTYHVARKKGEVPPLPKREEDIDVDSAVDSIMDDIPS